MEPADSEYIHATCNFAMQVCDDKQTSRTLILCMYVVMCVIMYVYGITYIRHKKQTSRRPFYVCMSTCMYISLRIYVIDNNQPLGSLSNSRLLARSCSTTCVAPGSECVRRCVCVCVCVCVCMCVCMLPERDRETDRETERESARARK